MDPISLLVVIEWTGSIFGLLGAMLLATNTQVSRWGWIAFLASNVLLIVLAISIGRWGWMTMQIGFLATSFLGIWRTFADPSRGLGSQMTNEIVERWLTDRDLVAMPAGSVNRAPIELPASRA